MRALAHPTRLALLELLKRRDTMTATEAATELSVTPALASFHLRTLAKYGFAQPAGGGVGRQRPWRSAGPYAIDEQHADPATARAAHETEHTRVTWLLQRIAEHWAARDELPDEWRHLNGAIASIVHLTPENSQQLQDDLLDVIQRYKDQADDTMTRPAGARPVHVVAFHMPEIGGESFGDLVATGA